MAALICLGCTAVYSVGAPACPQCGSTDHQEDSVSHITVHGGPSITAAAAGPDPGLDPVDVPASADTGDGSLDPVDVPAGAPAGDDDQGGAAALSVATPAKKSLKDQLAG